MFTPEPAGPGLVVADGGESEAAPRAQQQVHQGDRADGHAERQPEDDRLPGVPGDLTARWRCSTPEPPPSHEICVTSKPVYLGDHPGADGEVAAAQPESQARGGHGEERRHDSRQGTQTNGLIPTFSEKTHSV